MTTQIRPKAILILSSLLGANAFLWISVFLSAHRFPFLLTAGLIAFGFGLRHAVDVDHISAIDNCTRKLMRGGKRPVSVGFYFALGHSSVVIALCAALAVSTAFIQHHLTNWQAYGTVLGSAISAIFLYIIGIVNLSVLVDLYKALQATSRGEAVPDEHVSSLLLQRGLVGRAFMPLLKLVTRSYHMFLVGLLFGLGFDTATEVGILAMSVKTASMNVPFWVLMLLPLLFTAGMALIDTADGILMVGAYGWSASNASRSLHYNLTITTLSVLLAFAVATFELLQLVAQQLRVTGQFWHSVANLNIGSLGYMVVGAFCLIWITGGLIFGNGKLVSNHRFIKLT